MVLLDKKKSILRQGKFKIQNKHYLNSKVHTKNYFYHNRNFYYFLDRSIFFIQEQESRD